MKTRILDCTLRDGGHVNNAEFGVENIKRIINDLVDAHIDFVELGFLRDGVFNNNQSLFNDVKEIYPLLPDNIKNSLLTVMIRPDWYNINQLSASDGRISIIRFAFYYKDIKRMERYSKIAIGKGYRFICNPVNIMGYSNESLLELIHRVNEINPEQVTIVDTYGSMKMADLHRIYDIIENNLKSDIGIGLHLHENQALSLSLAQEFDRIRNKNRETVIDASLLGMGRIPGNLCLELITEYLNDTYGIQYDTDKIYHVIGKCIEPIKRQIPWGYSPAYFLTAKYNMHRSYAEYLLQKCDLQLHDINQILKQVDTDMRSEFYIDHIEKIYFKYREKK